jgi:Family of unknown function (DUF6499)
MPQRSAPMSAMASLNWREGDGYAPLIRMDRSGLAWEWLRRTASYQKAASASVPDGLSRMPNNGVEIVTALEERQAAELGVHFR